MLWISEDPDILLSSESLDLKKNVQRFRIKYIKLLKNVTLKYFYIFKIIYLRQGLALKNFAKNIRKAIVYKINMFLFHNIFTIKRNLKVIEKKTPF